jgi:hypothetical protein
MGSKHSRIRYAENQLTTDAEKPCPGMLRMSNPALKSCLGSAASWFSVLIAGMSILGSCRVYFVGLD